MTASEAERAQLAALQVQAAGYVHAWLAQDFWTIARIADEITRAGYTPAQVAEVFSLFAASLLTEAFAGARSGAAALAAARYGAEAGKQARLLSGRAAA